MSFNYESLRAKTQETLISFLHTELKFGITLVRSASIAADARHIDHSEQAKRSAIKAAETVRRFVRRVDNNRVRANILDKLAELDGLISML